MIFGGELVTATAALPSVVRVALQGAIESREFRFVAGAYDDGGGGVCPMVAAAMHANAWRCDVPGATDRAWGDTDGPTVAVEDFAAYFDLAVDEASLEWAISLVSRELRRGLGATRSQVHAA